MKGENRRLCGLAAVFIWDLSTNAAGHIFVLEIIT